MSFQDRAGGGRRLAGQVQALELVAPLVLGLPVGGIVVAAEVAAALGVPFDVFVAVGVMLPGGGDYGIGAVAEGLPEPVVSETSRLLGVGPRDLGVLADRAHGEVRRGMFRYRGGRGLPDVAGRDVVLVDDGSAAAVTVEAALHALRHRRPSRLVFAAPVCSQPAAVRADAVADDLVCVVTPMAVFDPRYWYDGAPAPTLEREAMGLLEGRFAQVRRAGAVDRRATAG